MRSLLLAVVACLCLSGVAVAQVESNARCLDLGELAGQPARVLWSHSFSSFLDSYRGDLNENQINLLERAINFGASRRFSLDDTVSVHTMKGLMASARQLLTRDQFSEILAGMGPQAQYDLAAVGVVGDAEIACSCKVGAGTGCPAGYPCTVGCHTWGTGEWNGLCVKAATPAGS